MRTVGIMGGANPAETIDFMRLLHGIPRAPGMAADQELQDVRIIVDSNPAVPDHAFAIAGLGPSPGPALAEMARGLEWAGAGFLVMPSGPAHAFIDYIVAATRLPFVNLIEESAAAVVRQYPAARRIGLLMDDASLDANLYQPALEAVGRTPLTPHVADQARFGEILERVKTGDRSTTVAAGVQAAAQALLDRGAEVILTVGMDPALFRDPARVAIPVVDAITALAKRTVAYAWGDTLPVTGGPDLALH